MNNLSLYILDLAQNSIRAKASNITIKVNEDIKNNIFEIEISDNGIGISKERLSKITDPFFSTRETRKVGLGLPFFKEICENCNGYLNIKSSLNQGTTIIGIMEYDHINRLPLGEIEETLYTLFINNENVDIEYFHKINNKKFNISTKEINAVLDGVSIKTYEIMKWIKEYILKSIEKIYEEGQ